MLPPLQRSSVTGVIFFKLLFLLLPHSSWSYGFSLKLRCFEKGSIFFSTTSIIKVILTKKSTTHDSNVPTNINSPSSSFQCAHTPYLRLCILLWPSHANLWRIQNIKLTLGFRLPMPRKNILHSNHTNAQGKTLP